MIVRRYLHAHGFRFRVDVGKLPGRPDLVLPKWRAAIMVHGCFWHRHAGCRRATMPESNIEFWKAKFAVNVERDARNLADLLGSGWRVAIIWECALKTRDFQPALDDLMLWLRRGKSSLWTSGLAENASLSSKQQRPE